MCKKVEEDLKLLEIDIPSGVTVPTARAAKILGVSTSSLKRLSSDWGLHTFWEINDRRYSLVELEAAKRGVLEPVGPAMVISDFGSITEYSIPDGFGFIVYGGKPSKQRIVDHYFAPDLCGVKEWIREKYGGGKYSLRLTDSQRRPTKYKFILELDGPSKLGDDSKISGEAGIGNLPCESPVQIGRIQRIKLTLQSLILSVKSIVKRV